MTEQEIVAEMRGALGATEQEHPPFYLRFRRETLTHAMLALELLIKMLNEQEEESCQGASGTDGSPS